MVLIVHDSSNFCPLGTFLHKHPRLELWTIKNPFQHCAKTGLWGSRFSGIYNALAS
jgi:hypothetical protein